jgi:hypothetical protein
MPGRPNTIGNNKCFKIAGQKQATIARIASW